MKIKTYNISIWQRDDKSPFIEIENENLIYANTEVHHGVQCVQRGGTPEHDQILETCREISDLFIKLEKLNIKQHG